MSAKKPISLNRFYVLQKRRVNWRVKDRLRNQVGDEKTAVSVNAIFGVQFIGQLFVVAKQFIYRLHFASVIDLNLPDKVGSHSAASPDDSRIFGGAVNDRLPLRFEQWKKAITQPVHVVK